MQIYQKKIDSLYEINFQKLDNIISFSNIKKIINDEIDNAFMTKLLPELSKTDEFISNYEIYEDYNLNITSFEEIDQILEEKIIQTGKLIIDSMKGNKYDLNKEGWNNADFSDFKRYEGNGIKSSFNSFNITNHKTENSEFDSILYKNLIDNFIFLIDDFISSFGKDFFDRILKYNEIQKVKGLYSNLKFSIFLYIYYY